MHQSLRVWNRNEDEYASNPIQLLVFSGTVRNALRVVSSTRKKKWKREKKKSLTAGSGKRKGVARSERTRVAWHLAPLREEGKGPRVVSSE
ncbi:hypothetical protein VTK73DRAFT_4412 [Phialemonium thermophilum]|uniref:Uncharacterized protein n=1 Tax=Phialemonium thermophilum TaxID=223376 RepID=A0ABR3V929_9PEZI